MKTSLILFLQFLLINIMSAAYSFGNTPLSDMDFDIIFENITEIEGDVFHRVSRFISEGKYGEAKMLLLSADEKARLDPLYYNWLGLINFRKKNYEEAERNWLISSRMNPMYYLPLYNLGVLHRNKGRYAKAAEYFESALEIKGDSDIVILKNLAFLNRNLGNYRRALVLWQSIRNIEGETAQYHREIGYIQMQLGNTRRAISSLSQARESSPNDPWVSYYLSLAHQKSSPQEGIEFARKAHMLDPGNSVFLYNLLHRLHASADKRGISEVLGNFDILSINDANLGGLLVDAAIFVDDSMFVDSMFNVLQQKNLADQTLFFNVGGYYYLNENYKKAIDIYTKGAKIATDPTRFYLNIAKSYFVLEDYANSIEWAQKVVLRENNPHGWHLLAMSHFIRGDREKAKKYIDRAYSISREEFSLARAIIHGEVSDYKELRQEEGVKAYFALFFAGDYAGFLSKTADESDNDIVFLRGVSFVNMGMGQDALREFARIRNVRQYRKRNINEHLGDAYRLIGNKNRAIESYEAEVRVNRTNTRALYKKAVLFYELSEINKVEDILKRVLQIEPNHSAANALMGNVMMKLGRSQEGLEIWRDIFNRGGRDFHLVRNYALALGKTSETRATALEKLASLLAENPDSVFLYMDIGEILHESEDFLGASQRFGNAAKKYGDKAYINQAISFVHANLFQRADSVLMLVENRESSQYLRARYITHFKMGELRQVIKIFHDNYSTFSGECDFVTIALQAYNKMAEHGRVLDLSEKYKNLFSDCREISQERVIALKSIALYGDAMEELRRMGIKNYADSFNLAILSYYTGKYSDFFDIYENVFSANDKIEYANYFYSALVKSQDKRRIERLRDEPDFGSNADKIMVYASFLVKIGEERRAAEYVQRAQKIDPSISQRYNVSIEEREIKTEGNQARVRILYVDEYNEAMRLISEDKIAQGIAILESLYEQGLDEPALFSDLAAAYMKLGKYDAAIEVLKKGHEKHPDNYYILFNLAACYYSIENFSRAMLIIADARKKGVYDNNFRNLEERIRERGKF